MPNRFSFLKTSLSILVCGTGLLGFSNGSIGGPRPPIGEGHGQQSRKNQR